MERGSDGGGRRAAKRQDGPGCLGSNPAFAVRIETFIQSTSLSLYRKNSGSTASEGCGIQGVLRKYLLSFPTVPLKNEL